MSDNLLDSERTGWGIFFEILVGILIGCIGPLVWLFKTTDFETRGGGSGTGGGKYGGGAE